MVRASRLRISPLTVTSLPRTALAFIGSGTVGPAYRGIAEPTYVIGGYGKSHLPCGWCRGVNFFQSLAPLPVAVTMACFASSMVTEVPENS